MFLPSGVARATGPPLGRDSKVISRYVFPDGELLDVGELVALAQEHNLEVRHVESLCEHYALTTRRWLDTADFRTTAPVRHLRREPFAARFAVNEHHVAAPPANLSG